MTKERRLAIEMWEQIVEALEQGRRDTKYARPIASVIKEEFCEEHKLKWKCNCWFCQYVRHDYRNMPSRFNIEGSWNGCQHCPLYHEHEDIMGYDECGCTETKETLWKQVYEDNNVFAAKRILELLKGEKQMIFDKCKVYTALNANRLEIGSKVIVSDTLQNLKCKVESEVSADELTAIRDEDVKDRFITRHVAYNLAYLIEKPAKLKWTDLKVGDIIQRGVTTTMVTRIDNDNSDTHVFIGGRCIVDEELEKWQKMGGSR